MVSKPGVTALASRRSPDADPAAKGVMPMKRRALTGAAAAMLASPGVVRAQAPITLNGASQFNDEHVFNRCMARFEELVKQYYNRPSTS
jgi:hypothetical protein